MITVTGASGVVLLPNQPLSFRFTPELYQSFPLALVNDFSGSMRPLMEPARISLSSTLGTQTIELAREAGLQTFFRRLIAEPLGGSGVTTLVPVLLVLLGVFAAQQQGKLRRQLDECNKRVGEVLRKRLQGDPVRGEDEQQVASSLAQLERASERIPDEVLLKRISFGYRVAYPLIVALHDQQFDQLDTMLANFSPGELPLEAQEEERAQALLSELANYRRERNRSSITLLHVRPDLPLLSERLAYLVQCNLLRALHHDDLDAILAADAQQMISLPQAQRLMLQRYQQLGRPGLPPLNPADNRIYLQLLELHIAAELPFEPTDYLLQHAPNRLLVIRGAPLSGKSTSLDLLQRAVPEPGVLYLRPLPAQEFLQHPLATLARLIEQALLALTRSDPRLWMFLRGAIQDEPGGLPTTLSQLRPAHADSDESRLSRLSEQLTTLKLTTISLALDDGPAPGGYAYERLHQFLQANLSQQICMRVALADWPQAFLGAVALPLHWDQASLARLLDEIMQFTEWAPGWSVAVPSTRLLAQVNNPYELQVWMWVLWACYHGCDLSSEDWARLITAMNDARQVRSPGATDWTLDDAQTALQTITAPQTGAGQ